MRAVGLLCVLAACSDDPTAPPEADVPLELCVGTDWTAYQNEGARWRRLAAPNGKATFNATARLSIATAQFEAGSPFLRVEQLTAEQAKVLYDCQAYYNPYPPDATARARVRGLGSDQYGIVSHGAVIAGSSQSDTIIRLRALASADASASDLVATRLVVPPILVDRAIIRRAQRYATSDTVTLDFASAEAFVPVEHELRWTGRRSWVNVGFRTAAGTNNTLAVRTVGEEGSGEQPRSVTIPSIPTARLAPGDLHELQIESDGRRATLFYHAPGDRTLELGPPMSAPTFAIVATAPYRRVRVVVPSQADYGATFSVIMRQWSETDLALRSFIILSVTREYLGGTPGTWSLTVPNLSGVELFDDVVGTKPGRFGWEARVSGSPFMLRPQSATDGMVVRTATSTGEQAP